MPTKDIQDHAVHGDQRKFGRLVSIDFSDRKHMLSAPPKMATSGVKYYFTKPALDQGNTSQCVAYSGEQFLMSGAIVNKMYKTPAALYKECQQADEWPGDNYDGTSVRALMKVLQSKKYLSEYKWAFDVPTVVSHLLKVGPVIFGTNWYDSMFEADRYGFIRIKQGSEVAGGHAYMIKGVNVTKKCPDKTTGALRLINSWGRGWGQNGCAWLSFEDAKRLIREYGEAAAATELVFSSTQSLEESIIT